MNSLEQIAYKLWCESRAMEDKGNQEALDPVRNRSAFWFGQATAFERAAWMVLGGGGVPLDSEYFAKADAKRLAIICGQSTASETSPTVPGSLLSK